MSRDEVGEDCSWRGEGSAGEPDSDQADHHAGPAVLGGQRPHYGLPPVDTEREGGSLYSPYFSVLWPFWDSFFVSL